MEPLPRVNPLLVMFSDHELDLIREAAQRREIEPVDLIREAVFDAALQERRQRLAEAARR